MTKEELIQGIIDNNFSDDNFTLEGVLRFLPKRLDRYGRLYGWDELEVQHRAFLYIMNIKGFKTYLENQG